MKSACTFFALIAVCLLSLDIQGQEANKWKPIETAFGRSGKLQADGTYKFSMPRRDLKIAVGGTPVKAGLALGSWAAFKGNSDDSMVMGDLVLVESEIEPVMAKLQAAGIEITALHNHILNESPRVMYMHISGRGNAVILARSLHDALALTKTPLDTSAPATTQKMGLNTDQIDQALGVKGKDNGGIYQVSVPRAETVKDNGMEVPASMGLATAINFQPAGGGKAATTGDFVLIGKEVNQVMRVLRENGIEVTAVHSHMLDEEPRLFFMHFWGNDDAIKLAKGLRAALDKTNSKKGQ
jgi:hypothetical protein